MTNIPPNQPQKPYKNKYTEVTTSKGNVNSTASTGKSTWNHAKRSRTKGDTRAHHLRTQVSQGIGSKVEQPKQPEKSNSYSEGRETVTPRTRQQNDGNLRAYRKQTIEKDPYLEGEGQKNQGRKEKCITYTPACNWCIEVAKHNTRHYHRQRAVGRHQQGTKLETAQ